MDILRFCDRMDRAGRVVVRRGALFLSVGVDPGRFHAKTDRGLPTHVELAAWIGDGSCSGDVLDGILGNAGVDPDFYADGDATSSFVPIDEAAKAVAWMER